MEVVSLGIEISSGTPVFRALHDIPMVSAVELMQCGISIQHAPQERCLRLLRWLARTFVPPTSRCVRGNKLRSGISPEASNVLEPGLKCTAEVPVATDASGESCSQQAAVDGSCPCAGPILAKGNLGGTSSSAWVRGVRPADNSGSGVASEEASWIAAQGCLDWTQSQGVGCDGLDCVMAWEEIPIGHE